MGLSCTPSEDDMISGTDALVTAAFTGMGLLCGFEVLLLILMQFRRRSGLYFWSLVIATVAEISVNIANILYYWVLKDSCPGITETLSILGTFLYVFFEYFTLYSRLSLIQPSTKTMRFILGVIFTEIILIEIPVAVVAIGWTVDPSSEFTPLYYTMWKTEAVTYTVVDMILSLTYVCQIREMWGKESSRETRVILQHIVYMAILVIGIDTMNAALVFVGPVYPIMYGLEGFVFAFKLKVEMWSLNQLTKISRTTLEKANEDLTGSTMAGRLD